MIKFKSVELKNFGSYEYGYMDFKPGKTLVSAGNGSGKSTVFEALSWVIYGKSNRITDVSRNSRGECSVKVRFRIDMNEYFITRYYNHSVNKNKVELICNGEDISCRLTKDTDNQIMKLGFPSYDIFISTVTILQGLPVNISKMTPVSRKVNIEEMFGLMVWDDVKKKFKDKSKTTKIEYDNAFKIFSEKKDEVMRLNTEIETEQKIKTEQSSSLKEDYKKLKLEYLDFKKEVEKLTPSKEELDFLAADEGEVRLISDLQIKREVEAKDIKNSLAKETCHFCGYELTKEKITELNNKLTFLRNNYRSAKERLTSLNEMIIEQKNKQSIYEDKARDLKNLENNLLSMKERLINSQEINLIEKKNKLSILMQELKYTKEDYDFFDKKIKNYAYIDELLQPSSKFRTSLLSRYISYINQILEEILPMVFPDIDSVEMFIDKKGSGLELKASRHGLDIEISSLSGGEARRVDVLIILALQYLKVKTSNSFTDLYSFDEIFDALDMKGVESILSCLDGLYGEDSSVYVISHREELKSMFESIVQIKKENGVSVIS
jgi:DNA repair exonuclease SbcCD ATPase subunit